MNTSALYRLAKILVSHVQSDQNDGRTLTYGQVSKRFGDINPRNLNNPLGRLCEIAKEAGFPAVTAIVVNQDTGMPGLGFYEYVGELYIGRTLQANEWDAFWLCQMEQVYSRTDWDKYLQALKN